MAADKPGHDERPSYSSTQDRRLHASEARGARTLVNAADNQHVKLFSASASRFAPRNDVPGLRCHGNVAESGCLRSATLRPFLSTSFIPGLIIMDDREQLSALIGDIYDAVFDPTQRTDVLDRIADFTGGRFGRPALEACPGQLPGQGRETSIATSAMTPRACGPIRRAIRNSIPRRTRTRSGPSRS